MMPKAAAMGSTAPSAAIASQRRITLMIWLAAGILVVGYLFNLVM